MNPAVALALVASTLGLSLHAATPIFKCTIKGSVTYQRDPCPSGEIRNPPTIEQLNAERQKKRQQAGNGAANTASPAVVTQPAPQAAADSAKPVRGRQEATPSTSTPKTPAASFTCDSRKYCSQMKSCEEARYFLAHCPGVKMDGDGDGIPCEKQFCNR